MINNLHITSRHLDASPTHVPFIGNHGQNAGNVRWNTLGQQMEVFDGSAWINISQNVTVGMTPAAEEAIHWAQEKMEEERALKAKIEKYPALNHAYKQYKIVQALVYEEEKSDN